MVTRNRDLLAHSSDLNFIVPPPNYLRLNLVMRNIGYPASAQ